MKKAFKGSPPEDEVRKLEIAPVRLSNLAAFADSIVLRNMLFPEGSIFYEKEDGIYRTRMTEQGGKFDSSAGVRSNALKSWAKLDIQTTKKNASSLMGAVPNVIGFCPLRGPSKTLFLQSAGRTCPHVHRRR